MRVREFVCVWMKARVIETERDRQTETEKEISNSACVQVNVWEKRKLFGLFKYDLNHII